MITLFALAVKTSVLLGAALVITRCLRQASAATRHFILACSVIAALLLPAVSPIVPEWELPASLAPTIAAPGPTSPSPRATAIAPNRAGHATESAPVAWDSALLLGWLTGAGVVVGSLIVGAFRLRSLRRFAATADAEWQRQAETLARSVNVRRRVIVLISGGPIVPLTWGHFRPCILLPAESVHWSEDRRATVLAHEVSHVARGDWLMRIVGQVLCALHWFNPLAWLVSRRRQEESERACDDRVLAAGINPAAYAAVLLDLARSTRGPAAVTAPAIVRASNLERRVHAMLNPTLNRSFSSRTHQAVIAGTALAVVVALAAVSAAQTLASFGGSLVDVHRGFLPNAALVLTSADGATRIEVKSDRSGRFEFPPLVPGTYSMEVRLPGFSRFTSTVSLQAGQRVEPEIQMRVGGLQETIYVFYSGATGDDEPRPRVQEVLPRPIPPCPADASGPRVGGNIRPPVRIRNVSPVYPVSLRGSGRGETVHLTGTIGLDGKMENIQAAGQPAPEFELAAVDAIREWAWDQTLLNCQAVPVEVDILIRFDSVRKAG